MRFLLLTLVLVTSCTDDAGLAAERRYEMVERHGTPEEQCEAIKAVADTYLRLGDEQKYERWNFFARNKCLAVEANRRLHL
jgi:hypothetical protein